MARHPPPSSPTWPIAARWCEAKGGGWAPTRELGVGGTAPVFEVQSPFGPRALKIYDEKFSSGELGAIEQSRIEQQLSLKDHNCPSLVHVYEGGMVEDRLYLLMSRAPGAELEKRLADVPTSKIRVILHQVAQACIFLRSRGLCHRDIKAANIFVSDDFSRATLLDISVIRTIRDPVGVGTDHDGQLPVLATARYSPPEYLFRLIDPSPSLWHALDIYQLGALLHDLAARIPLFQDEYERSRANRYRFAWVVATQDPAVDALDLDDDLRLLARRALDKNWERRSKLCLEDFLDDPQRRQRHALELLGLYREPAMEAVSPIQHERARLEGVSGALESHLVEFLRARGVVATHEVLPEPRRENARQLRLEWTTSDEHSTVGVSLSLMILLEAAPGGQRFAIEATLARRLNGETRSAEMSFPAIVDDGQTSSTLAGYAEAALSSMAVDLVEMDSPEGN